MYANTFRVGTDPHNTAEHAALACGNLKVFLYVYVSNYFSDEQRCREKQLPCRKSVPVVRRTTFATKECKLKAPVWAIVQTRWQFGEFPVCWVSTSHPQLFPLALIFSVKVGGKDDCSLYLRPKLDCSIRGLLLSAYLCIWPCSSHFRAPQSLHRGIAFYHPRLAHSWCWLSWRSHRGWHILWLSLEER